MTTIRRVVWTAVLACASGACGGGDDDDGPGGTAGAAGLAGGGGAGGLVAGAGAGGAAGVGGGAGGAGVDAGPIAGSGGSGDSGMPDAGPDPYAVAAASPLSTPLLVILLDFADSDFADDLAEPETDWAGLIFGTDQAEGNHYWYEVSGGTFQLLPAEESYGTANNGVIRAKVSAARPTGTMSYQVEDQDWIPEALEQAAEFIDFAAYDEDGDGRLQNGELAVMFPLNASGDNLNGANAQANVPLDYALSGSGLVVEKFTRVLWFYTSIGVNMHELGHHLFGLDHFPAPSVHCLMGSGAYGADPDRQGLYGLLLDGTRPTHLLGYHKQLAGFVEGTTLTETTVGLTLHSASSGEYNLVRLPLARGAVYLEYRTAEGYDQSVPFCSGHTGGLFATEVADRIVPLNAVDYELGRSTATYDTVLTQDFCEFYSLPGYNDGWQLGQYTISNLAVSGSTLTLDVTRSAAAPVVDHHKLRYAAAGASGELVWRHVLLEPGTPIDLDFATFNNGTDPAAYRVIELLAYYDTGEIRSVNAEAEYTSSTPYLQFSKSYALEAGDLGRQGIVAMQLESGQPYAQTATVQVTAGTFQGSFRLINLPSY